jgi:hypothetical protein
LSEWRSLREDFRGSSKTGEKHVEFSEPNLCMKGQS